MMGWKSVMLADVIVGTEYGTSEPTAEGGTRPIIGMKHLADGVIKLEDFGYVDEGTRDWSPLTLHRGDILLNRTNSPALVGRTGIVREDSDAVFASYLVRLHPDLERVDPGYLNCWLNSAKSQGHIRKLATRGVSQANVNPTTLLKELPVLLPPLPEQVRIAEILRTWDDAIDQSEQVAALKSRKLDALRADIFASQMDGGVFRPLAEISTRIRRQTDGEPHEVMTISAKSGFVAQADKYSRDMAGASVANYTLLRQGDFAYNKGNSLTFPQGCIFKLEEDSALVPNVYVSFALDESLNAHYFEHYFAAGSLNRQLAEKISSGVRNNGLLNINARDFFSVKVPVPDRLHQDTAADLLDLIVHERDLLREKAELLRAQKRGLMQKLLTGEVRVTVDMEAIDV